MLCRHRYSPKKVLLRRCVGVSLALLFELSDCLLSGLVFKTTQLRRVLQLPQVILKTFRLQLYAAICIYNLIGDSLGLLVREKCLYLLEAHRMTSHLWLLLHHRHYLD